MSEFIAASNVPDRFTSFLKPLFRQVSFQMSPVNFTGRGNRSFFVSIGGHINFIIHKTTCALLYVGGRQTSALLHIGVLSWNILTLKYETASDYEQEPRILWTKSHLWDRGVAVKVLRWPSSFALEGRETDANGEYTERKTCGGGLLIMHLFAKQINRGITQTNISHRTASVKRPIPEEKACVCLWWWVVVGGGRQGKSVYSFCNIHTAETHNSPKNIQPRPNPPLSTTVGDVAPGIPGSYEQLLDVMVSSTSPVHTLDSGAASQREKACRTPEPHQFNYIH